MNTAPSLYDLFAEKLTQHPELLSVARNNCARWLSEGHCSAHRLREWDALLAEAQQGEPGMERLRYVLRGGDEKAARLRDFHPLAGILTDAERMQARELRGYRH